MNGAIRLAGLKAEVLGARARGRITTSFLIEDAEWLVTRVGDLEKAGDELRDALPDSKHEGELSWGWCWQELTSEAQEQVKDARAAWAAAKEGMS